MFRPHVEGLEERTVPASLSLDYHPLLERDLRHYPGNAKGTSLHGIAPNLATDHKHTWFIHGNSLFDVLKNGQKANAKFTTQRYDRGWQGPLNADGSQGALVVKVPWEKDGDSKFDVPGEILALPPDQWPSERQLQEFVVGIKRHKNAGYWYFTVVVDTQPCQYRVTMSQAEHITGAEYRLLRVSEEPFGTTVQGTVSTGWVNVPDNGGGSGDSCAGTGGMGGGFI
jgi:hypothetical protein